VGTPAEHVVFLAEPCTLTEEATHAVRLNTAQVCRRHRYTNNSVDPPPSLVVAVSSSVVTERLE
jgi:hypothetical protein